MTKDPLTILIASLATLGLVAGVGWGASQILNGKANAVDLIQLSEDHHKLENIIVTREDFARLEKKVDALLIRNGIKTEQSQ